MRLFSSASRAARASSSLQRIENTKIEILLEYESVGRECFDEQSLKSQTKKVDVLKFTVVQTALNEGVLFRQQQPLQPASAPPPFRKTLEILLARRQILEIDKTRWF